MMHGHRDVWISTVGRRIKSSQSSHGQWPQWRAGAANNYGRVRYRDMNSCTTDVIAMRDCIKSCFSHREDWVLRDFMALKTLIYCKKPDFTSQKFLERVTKSDQWTCKFQ